MQKLRSITTLLSSMPIEEWDNTPSVMVLGEEVYLELLGKFTQDCSRERRNTV